MNKDKLKRLLDSSNNLSWKQIVLIMLSGYSLWAFFITLFVMGFMVTMGYRLFSMQSSYEKQWNKEVSQDIDRANERAKEDAKTFEAFQKEFNAEEEQEKAEPQEFDALNYGDKHMQLLPTQEQLDKTQKQTQEPEQVTDNPVNNHQGMSTP